MPASASPSGSGVSRNSLGADLPLFLATVALEDGELLLGACTSEKQGEELLMEYAVSRAMKERDDGKDRKAAELYLKALYVRLAPRFRLERVA